MAKRVRTSMSTKGAQAKKRTAKTASAAGSKAKSAKKVATRTSTAKASAMRGASPAERKKAKATRSASAKAKAAKTAAAKEGTARRTTKKAPSAKKGTTRGAVEPAESPSAPPVEKPVPPPQTYLTDAELAEYRELLLGKRAELAGDVKRLATEALNSKGSGQGERSAMPIHMADLGTDNWEQEFTLGLLESEEALVREIDEALCRVQDRTYGMCLGTHKRISKARLRAKPWAKFCIEYARAREEGRLT